MQQLFDIDFGVEVFATLDQSSTIHRMNASQKNAALDLLAQASRRIVSAITKSVSTGAIELPLHLVAKPRSTWLSQAERLYLERLTKLLANRGYVFPRVRLTSVLEIERPIEHIAEAVRMDRRTIPFLICDCDFRPCVAIFLVDPASASAKTPREYSALMLENAKFPVIEWSTDRDWNPKQLADMFPAMLRSGGRPESGRVQPYQSTRIHPAERFDA